MDLVQIDQNVYSRNGNIVFFSKRWRCLFPAGGSAVPPAGGAADGGGSRERGASRGRRHRSAFLLRSVFFSHRCKESSMRLRVNPAPDGKNRDRSAAAGEAPAILGHQTAAVTAHRCRACSG